MNAVMHRRHEMFRRVRDYGRFNQDAFPAGTLGHQLFQDMLAIVAELDHLASAQSSSVSRAITSSNTKTRSRKNLKDYMSRISRTARALAGENPGIDAKFRMPRKTNEQELLETARAFLAEATIEEQKFLDFQMPERFLQTLASYINQFEEAGRELNEANDTRSDATSEIPKKIEAGIKTWRRLDVIVRNRYGSDKIALKSWESASNVNRGRRKTTKPQPKIAKAAAAGTGNTESVS
ncbi:MAG: hypothetical protein ACKV2V_21155 [Blastocatellia bacterium]